MQKERVELKVKKKVTFRLTEQEALALKSYYDMTARMIRERFPDGVSVLNGDQQQTVDEIFADLEAVLGRYR